MGNKVQVIFTFELKDHGEAPGQKKRTVNIMELVTAKVGITGLSEWGQAGPHDVCAVILKDHSPVVMQLIADEMERGAKALGFDMAVHRVKLKTTSDNIH